MKTKKHFQIAEKLVRESIFRIDPYALLSDGGPDDEFDSEIISIVGQLGRCGSGKDVAHAIARILNSAFSEKHEPREFEQEGNLIFDGLIENGIKSK